MCACDLIQCNGGSYMIMMLRLTQPSAKRRCRETDRNAKGTRSTQTALDWLEEGKGGCVIQRKERYVLHLINIKVHLMWRRAQQALLAPPYTLPAHTTSTFPPSISVSLGPLRRTPTYEAENNCTPPLCSSAWDLDCGVLISRKLPMCAWR